MVTNGKDGKVPGLYKMPFLGLTHTWLGLPLALVCLGSSRKGQGQGQVQS